MNKVVFIFVAAVAANCTGISRSEHGDINSLDRARLIQKAKQELANRHLSLPGDYDVAVETGEIGNEINPPRQVYMLHFRFAYRGKNDLVYSVFIDKRSGAIDQVVDYRQAVKTRL